MNEIYSKISVLILTLRLCFVERIGCEVPVAVGIQVGAFQKNRGAPNLFRFLK